MSNKKLVYVLNYYSADSASHFYHILGLLEELAKQDCQIILLIEKLEGELPTFKHPNINALALSAQNSFYRQFQLFLIARKLIKDGFTTAFIRITAISTITFGIAYSFSKGRTFLWQSGKTIEYDRAQPISLKKFRWYLTSFLPNFIARRVCTFFVTGPESMAEYYSKQAFIPKRKIKILYNDIDHHRFKPSTNNRDDLRVVDLLIVHRLSPVRRTDYYLESLFETLTSYESGNQNDAHFPDWRLTIIGDGETYSSIERLASKYLVRDRVLLKGSIPNRDIQAYYEKADIFLQPSWAEGLPRTLLEAMACGLPIVATDAGGTLDIVGAQQEQYVSPIEDRSLFASNILNLMLNRHNWQRLSVENRSVIMQKYTTPLVAQMYIEKLFEE